MEAVMMKQKKLLLLSLALALVTLAVAQTPATGSVKNAWPEYRGQDANTVANKLAASGLVKAGDIFVWEATTNPNGRSPPFNPGTDQSVWLYTNFDNIVYHVPTRGIWHQNRVGPGWTELVGVDYNAAIQTILKEVIGVTVVYGPVGFPRTKDLRTDRVFLEYDSNKKVASVPKIG